jgi:hypothetical protein
MKLFGIDCFYSTFDRSAVPLEGGIFLLGLIETRSSPLSCSVAKSEVV